MIVEPELIPLESTNFKNIQGNQTEKARLDIAATGLWGPFQKTMFDVRIFHPYAKTYEKQKLSDIYARHESEERRNYLQRKFRCKTQMLHLLFLLKRTTKL